MLSQKSLVRGLVLVFLLVFATQLSAQTTQELLGMSLEELLDVRITTASRSGRSIRELPSTVHIITREEILNNSYSTLVDALKDILGVKVSQPGTGTHGEKYLIRGLWGNNYAKILINGIPIRPSAVDGMPIGEQISMKNIERIEVVYGPASALYGADALAGIINIVTYNPEQNSVQLETSLGTADYMSTKFFVNQIKKDLKLNIYGGHSERDDLNIKKDVGAFSDITLDGDTVRIGALPSESHNVGIEILFRGLHFSFDHMYRSDHSSLEQDSRYYIYDNPELKYGEAIRKVSLKHILDVEKLKLTSFVSYIRYRLDTESAFGMIFYPTPLYKFTGSDDILFEESVIYNLDDSLELVGGFSYQYSGAMPKSNDLIKPFDDNFYRPFSKDIPERGIYQSLLLGDFGWNPLTYYNVGGFLQGSYSTDRFAVTLGTRYDVHSEYENKFNPRVAGLYNISESTSIRASYNEAFRAPSPYKVYDSIAIDNRDGTIFYMQIPNEDLEPEEFSTFEVGSRHMFDKNISVELIGYRNRIAGLVTSGSKELDPDKYPHADGTHANVDINNRKGASVLNGVDFVASLSDIYRPMKFTASLYLSYARGEEMLPNGDEIDIFRNVPEFMTKFRINMAPIKNLYIGIDNIYSSRWYARVYSKDDLENPDNESNAYFTMDLVTHYSISSEYGNFRVIFKAINVFNEAYGGFKYRDNPQYGRTFYGGIEYSF